MKPFRNTVLAILIEDLQRLARLLGNISIFLGVLSYVEIIDLNINFPTHGLKLVGIGILMIALSYFIEWIYLSLKKRYEAK